jgi:hypothetical protein
MKKIFLILLFNIFTSFVFAQNNDVYTIVEKMPEFIGDLEKAKSDISNQIPCLKDGGKYYFRVIIEKDGSLSNIELLRGTLEPNNDFCKKAIDKVFINVLQKWNSGMQGGNPVRVYYNIPINKN